MFIDRFTDTLNCRARLNIHYTLAIYVNDSLSREPKMQLYSFYLQYYTYIKSMKLILLLLLLMLLALTVIMDVNYYDTNNMYDSKSQYSLSTHLYKRNRFRKIINRHFSAR